MPRPRLKDETGLFLWGFDPRVDTKNPLMDWKRLQARYAQLSWQQRLGNLASTLARAATAASNPRTMASVPDMLREGMWVIEWSRADTPIETLIELAPMS
jgi:hypothetical protein